MKKKTIFFKKNINFFNLFIFLIILFLIFFSFIFYNLKNNKNIIIPIFVSDFFLIPIDKEGAKIENTNKKSLHLNDNNLVNFEKSENTDLIYSIQFKVSSDYSEIKETLYKFINNSENIYNISDFYTLSLTSELGIDYFLLYKNFDSKKDANDHCRKYLVQLDNCLIVNAQKIK